MSKKLFVSGPITGIHDDNVDAFERAAHELDEAGYKVTVPTRMVKAGTPHAKAMRKCIGELVRCDGVAQLAGWTCSKGAVTEARVGLVCGMRVMSVDAWVEEAKK